MNSLDATIHTAAARHTALLHELAALDYAPSALAQSSAYLSDLQEQKERADRELALSAKRTEKERAEHIELQKSVGRKWASKLTGRGGKFGERVSKEEREYLESLQQELSQRSQQEKLSSDLLEATRINEDLKSASSRRDAVSRELDELYNRVFDGPTPEFPDDDEFEHRAQAAGRENSEAHAALSVESQTLSILSDAGGAMRTCVQKMKEARSHSTDDMWGFGGFADMMESNSLTVAQCSASQADMLISQARRLNAAVGELPPMQIPKQSTSDVYFDNIFSDMAQHDRIKHGLETVQRAAAQLQTEITAAEERVNIAVTQASVTAERLTNARRELHDLRAATFASIAEHDMPATEHGPDDPPPAFSAGSGPGTMGTASAYAPPPGHPPGWSAPTASHGTPSAHMSYVGSPPGPVTPSGGTASAYAASADSAPREPSFPSPVVQRSPFSPAPDTPLGGQDPLQSSATFSSMAGPAGGDRTASSGATPAGWSSMNPYAALLAAKAKPATDTA